MAYSLTSISDLGTVNRERIEKKSELIVNPRVLSDSSDTDVFDFGGATRIITIEGTIKDTPTNLATAEGEIEALINGDQSSFNSYPYTYTSDILGTVSVKFLAVSAEYTGGTPTVLRYTIQMVESSSV